VIDIDNIRICYGGQEVIRRFSLSANPREKIVLSGPSGSGKSSILRALLGLVIPDEGTISIGSCAIDNRTVWPLRTKMGYVAQEPDMGEGTVRDVVDRCFSFKANHTLKDNLNRLNDMLTRFYLSEAILDKDLSALSGGEKQRVALVIALLLDREILLLDEVSSALDRKCTEAVADYLQTSPQTVLLVTHDDRLMRIADRVVEIGSSQEEAN
jgi:ABC-type bacteriocin/lantibiotic exporter with double-glycine peptidase domain